MNKNVSCVTCSGSGVDWDTKSNYGEMTPFECVDCHGTGRVSNV